MSSSITQKKYGQTTSFSGADMLVYFTFPGAKPIYVGTGSTLTYSTFREIRQVRTLGRINLKGVTRGPRTIGGTLIFTVIEQHIVNDIMNALNRVTEYNNYDKIKPDELPPFDIIISFANEYGQRSSKVIHGVTIVDDGMTLSIEDLFTENTITYIARDLVHMKTGDVSSIFEGGTMRFRAEAETIRRAVIKPIQTPEQLAQHLRRAEEIGKGYTTDPNPWNGPVRLGL